MNNYETTRVTSDPEFWDEALQARLDLLWRRYEADQRHIGDISSRSDAIAAIKSMAGRDWKIADDHISTILYVDAGISEYCYKAGFRDGIRLILGQCFVNDND